MKASAFEKRRALFESALAPGEPAAVRIARQWSSAPDVRSTCPCCGYPTIAQRHAYDICALCDWEDDGQDDPWYCPPHRGIDPAKVNGGPNGDYSLREARANFQEHGTQYRPSDPTFLRGRSASFDEARLLAIALWNTFLTGRALFAQADAEARAVIAAAYENEED